VVGNGCGGGI